MSSICRKFQIGRGTEILDGYVNTDLSPLKGIDVSCTIDAGGLSFADDTFAEVLAINILEHVDLVDAMREIHRALEPGGRLVAEVPHFTSADMYGDPTHRTFFSLATFEFLPTRRRAITTLTSASRG